MQDLIKISPNNPFDIIINMEKFPFYGTEGKTSGVIISNLSKLAAEISQCKHDEIHLRLLKSANEQMKQALEDNPTLTSQHRHDTIYELDEYITKLETPKPSIKDIASQTFRGVLTPPAHTLPKFVKSVAQRVLGR